MAKPKENTERVYTFLSQSDVAILKEQAEAEGSNVSAILRRLTKQHIRAINQKEGDDDGKNIY